MQKRVLEVLKTCYFSYSAFWSAGQWGAIAPPPGYATAYYLNPGLRTRSIFIRVQPILENPILSSLMYFFRVLS